MSAVTDILIVLMIVGCLFVAWVVLTITIGYVIVRLTNAAKEVVDYYLQRKREMLEEMEEELNKRNLGLEPRFTQ